MSGGLLVEGGRRSRRVVGVVRGLLLVSGALSTRTDEMLQRGGRRRRGQRGRGDRRDRSWLGWRMGMGMVLCVRLDLDRVGRSATVNFGIGLVIGFGVPDLRFKLRPRFELVVSAGAEVVCQRIPGGLIGQWGWWEDPQQLFPLRAADGCNAWSFFSMAAPISINHAFNLTTATPTCHRGADPSLRDAIRGSSPSQFSSMASCVQCPLGNLRRRRTRS